MRLLSPAVRATLWFSAALSSAFQPPILCADEPPAGEKAAVVPIARPERAVAPALTGAVFDVHGQPIAKARIDIATAAPRTGISMFCPSCYRDCAKWAESDADGAFTIADLDPSLKFQILCTAPGKIAQVTKLIDPRNGALSIQLEPAPTDLDPQHTIRAQLVNAQGIPIEGALIDPEGAETSSERWWGRVEGAQPTVSDHEGRFVMPLADDYRAVDLEILADGYAGTQVALVKPGPDEHRIIVPIGASITGTIAFAAKPVAGLRIAVVQETRTTGTHFIKAVEAVTDAEGRFAFAHLPANQPYVIYTPVMGNVSGFVLSVKRFGVPDDGASRDLGTLNAMQALHLNGRIQLPKEMPVPKKAKLSLGRDPAWDLISVDIDADGRFEIGALAPETYEVRMQLKGLALDAEELNYQLLNQQSFGIRLTSSLDDLRIPLKTSAGKESQ